MRHFMNAILALLFLGGVAQASDCDITEQFPNHPGVGPIYRGESRMTDVAPGGAPVVQWNCFFPNRGDVQSVSVRLLRRDGSAARYVTYETTINRNYSDVLTEIKVSLQRIRPLTTPERGLRFVYTIQFGAAPLPASVSGSTPVSCINQVCVTIHSDGKVDHFDTNSVDAPGRSRIDGGTGPFVVSCTTRAEGRLEMCAVVDSQGRVWAGPLRMPAQWRSVINIPSPQ